MLRVKDDIQFSNKSTIFCDITLCGPLFAICFHAGFLLGLFVDPEDGVDMFPPKRRLTLNRLHGVISQKTVLFITTAVRTSDPTVQ
jgi:hypothetical protein